MLGRQMGNIKSAVHNYVQMNIERGEIVGANEKF